VRRLALGVALVLMFVAAAAWAAAENPPSEGTQVRNATGGALQDRTSHSAPEALFVEKCGMCHRQMGMGTVILARRMDPAKAMLEKRGDLTAAYVTASVRNGVGNMPRISRGEVSDRQLKVIAEYLTKVPQ
jgi:mono/diheme cytochrome c family protein